MKILTQEENKMKRLTQEEINKVLENHKHWLAEDCDKWENMQADFSYCDLRNADLHNADLRNADLHNADLRNADLHNADLHNANLHNANLHNADLLNADLHNADLHNADLHNANLYNADLYNADLHNANLRNADLRNANLLNADLRNADLLNADLLNADLLNADLRNADLRNTDLHNAKNVPYFPMVCPEEGDFIGWKQAGNRIIKLHIPEDALRSSSTTRKCRCSKAEVVEIYNFDGTIADERQVASSRDSSFVYEIGKTVEVKDFDTNRWEECTRGIHFFLNRQEAIYY